MYSDDNEMKISLIEKQWLLKKPAKSIFLVLPSFFIFCNKRLSLFRLKRSTRRSCKTAIRFIRRNQGFPVHGQRTCSNGKTAKKKL